MRLRPARKPRLNAHEFSCRSPSPFLDKLCYPRHDPLCGAGGASANLDFPGNLVVVGHESLDLGFQRN